MVFQSVLIADMQTKQKDDFYISPGNMLPLFTHSPKKWKSSVQSCEEIPQIPLGDVSGSALSVKLNKSSIRFGDHL